MTLRSWSRRRVALVGAAALLLILAIRLAPQPVSPPGLGHYRYYTIKAPGGGYFAGPGGGVAGSIRLWALLLLPHVPSTLLALGGLIGLSLGLRRRNLREI